VSPPRSLAQWPKLRLADRQPGRDARGLLLSAKLAGYFRCNIGDGVHRDVPLQFIDEGAAGFLDLRGARDAMHEFSGGHCRDSDLNLAESLLD
jgi:hypothetical protein